MTSTRQTQRPGFTLVELLIVVLILGILAAMVIPSIAASRQEAEQVAFIEDLRIFSNAVYVFRHRTGYFPDGTDPGQLPDGLGSYLDAAAWMRQTPIGGQWHLVQGEMGVRCGVGVDFGANPNRDDAYMLRIDQINDDGDLATGGFRKFDEGRYYSVLTD